jgi:hypothetical protein
MSKYKNIEDLKNARSWKRADNYAGYNFSEYVVAFSQNRDSDALTRANFKACLEKLGGESEDSLDDSAEVVVSHSGHWAVGWVEQILVHKKAAKKLEVLRNILNDFEDYPVIDDSALSEEEEEERQETWESCDDSMISDVLKYFESIGLSEDARDALEKDQIFREMVQDMYIEDTYCSGLDDAWAIRNNDFQRYYSSMMSGRGNPSEYVDLIKKINKELLK